MSLISRSASFLAKSSLSLIGVVGLAATIAAPASAENASVSGAMTRTSPGGFTTTVSGEMVAPDGMYFMGPLTVEGTIPDAGTANLSVNALTTTSWNDGAPSLLEGEVLRALNDQDLETEQGLDAYVAILKAAVGENGLENGGVYPMFMD